MFCVAYGHCMASLKVQGKEYGAPERAMDHEGPPSFVKAYVLYIDTKMVQNLYFQR